MKRKSPRPKTRPAARPPGAAGVSPWASTAPKRIATVSRILLAAIVLYAAARFFTTGDTYSIPLDSSNRQSWILKNVRHFEPGDDYSSIECDEPCYVISPSQLRLGINPADAPYARVIFAPGSSAREPRILLSSPSESGAFLGRRGSLQADHLFCDLRDFQPYASVAPYTSTIDRIGVSFTGRMLLRRIEVSGTLSLADYGLLVRDAFATREPSTPHSINELFGVYILGHNHTAWAIALFILVTLLILSFAGARHPRKISVALVCTGLFLYLPWLAYFSSEVARSFTHSSLRTGLYDEYASRYGEEFASLSRALNDSIPPGSRVHFIRRSIDAYPTEGNLAAFVHSIRFEPCEFAEADYYFGCSCPGIYDRASGRLTEPLTGKTARVAPIYRQDDSFLLRALK